MSMTYHICKACGRSIRSTEKPNFCYHCHVDSTENIGDEDAEKKMGLFQDSGSIYRHQISHNDKVVQFEFPGDIRYWPFNEEFDISKLDFGHYGLSDFQDEIMRKVVKE